jgi:hypothetical protein
MANEEQLSILKQSVGIWNEWREANKGVLADLRAADLSQADWREVDFRATSLYGANLIKANLTRAKLSAATFYGANLIGASLRETRLIGTDMRASLRDSDFAYARMSDVNFSGIDLSQVRGLHNVTHEGPSTIGIDVIARSQGKIPEIFLRGCGVNSIDIEYAALFDPGLSNEEIKTILY